MDDETLLNALKEKAQSISSLYVDTWFDILQERIEAAAAVGATECPAREFGRWDGLWDKPLEKELSILDFIRNANRGGSGSTYFYSFKSRTDKSGCLMAYNIDGKSACLISSDDFDRLPYPVRQQLDEYLTELAVTQLHKVAERLIQAGFTLSFMKNPETDPRIGIPEEELDEDGYDGEYDMYIKISWDQPPPKTKPTNPTPSQTPKAFWYRIVGE